MKLKSFWSTIKYALRIIVALFAILPIYVGFITALTPYAHISESMLWPKYWYFKVFAEIWSYIPLSRMLFNGLVYAIFSTLLNLFVCVLAAYALSRFKFFGKRFILFGLLVTQMMAEVVVLPSVYLLLRSLNLINTYTGLIIVLAGVNAALAVWMLIGFFDSIPRELEEAAFIDGANQVDMLVRVIIPLLAPGIAATSIFSFLNSYNSFIIPLVLLSKESLYPVTLGLYNIACNQEKYWHLLMAGSLIYCLPPLLIFLGMQRFIIKGLTAGAVKM